jgi:hypothetical protein
VRNNDQLRSIVCELDSGTDETLAALTTQLANLQDCLKAGQPTAQLLTRIVALAGQASQQVNLSCLFHSPLWEDEEEFSCATHRHAEALVRLRNIQVALPRGSTVGQTSTIEGAVFGLFRDTLSLVNGYADRRSEDIRIPLSIDVTTVQVREYTGGVPSELLEQFEFRPNGVGNGAGVLRMGEKVDDFFEPFEVVCGNTALVLAITHGDEH